MKTSASPSESPSSCVFPEIPYTTTNASAQIDARKRSAMAVVSARGFGTPGGTIRSLGCAPGSRRRLPTSSTSADRSRSRALLMQAPPDQHADDDERGGAEEPGDEPFRHGADASERPAAAIVGMLRPDHIGDERVELRFRDLVRREARHDVRTDPHRLGDLRRRRFAERRRYGMRHIAATGDDLVAARAVVGEERLSLRDAAALRPRIRYSGALAERRDVPDERLDLPLGEEQPAAARLDAVPLERHVARAEVEVGRERADAAKRRADRRARRRLAGPVRAVATEAVPAVELL